jgi:Mg/Co/Ni transporter MgtE
MRAADALQVVESPAVAIARNGRIVGVLRRAALLEVAPETPIEQIMEPPITVPWDAPTSTAVAALARLDGAPVPVVDDRGTLIGEITP